MKKRLMLLLLLMGASIVSVAAQEAHAQWRTEVKQLEKDLYRVSMTADIDSSWHIYDTLRTEFGPTATVAEFNIADGRRAEKVGGVNISKEPYKYYDDIYMMEIGYFEESVTFSQDIRLKKKNAEVELYVEWMTCDENNCTTPQELAWTVSLPDMTVTEVDLYAEDTISAPSEAAGTEGKSLWGIIIEAILWGFAALLTPCVFPMVPMTVSYFLKGDGSVARGRMRAAIYGIFIVALYTLPIAIIILVTRIVGGDAVTADIFNWLATHWTQ